MIEDLTGERFFRWAVLGYCCKKKGFKYYDCKCDCGTVRPVMINSLKKGTSKSCGCWHRERSSLQKGKKNPHWKGGSYINDIGYKMIYCPVHPRSMVNGYVREHLLIAEKALGKSLPLKSQVHHYGNVSDNSKIIICEDQLYHLLLHIRQRALKESGDANKRKCKYCKEYDHVENLYIQQSKRGHGWNVYHRACESEYSRKKRNRVFI